METQIEIEFIDHKIPETGTLVLFAASKKKWGPSLKKLDKLSDGQISSAMAVSSFEGGKNESISIVSPANLELTRLIILGLGDESIEKTSDWMNVGGRVCGLVKNDPTGKVSLVIENIGKELTFSADATAATCNGFFDEAL